jgi:AraC family transcriptional regulator, regulatory protein of adaptative response / methylated-DNA-[protein]-cysteine methyltransferase
MPVTHRFPNTVAPNARIERVCRYIEAHAEASLSLAQLAELAGFSRFHFQRTFKAVTGVTPKAYQENARLKTLKQRLRKTKRVTDAIYDAGYGSSSRMYEKVDTRLGMTPLQYRKGGAGVEISYAFAESPLGLLLMAATDRGVCFVQFADSKRELEAMLAEEYPAATRTPMRESTSPHFKAWMQALAQHLAGKLPALDLPLDVRGTSFQLKVWRYLQSIPYGTVQSYTEVAAGIQQPSATRAVATACASNVAGVLIPCHRVIRSNGELGGYRWGLHRKRALIDRERSTRTRA